MAFAIFLFLFFLRASEPFFTRRHFELKVRITASGGEALSLGGTAIASANFSDTIKSDGWSRLSVRTNASFSDEQQAYAAGYLESYLTNEKIYESVVNSGANFSWPTPLEDFLSANDAFMRRSIVENAPSPYWHQVALVLLQLDGIIFGYQDSHAPGKALPSRSLYNVQLGGDMEDLAAALNISSPRQVKRSFARGASGAGEEGAGHCSALVRLLEDNSDVLFGHVTWAGFEDMTRVLKTYDFPWSTTGLQGAPTVPGATVRFSSMPASLFSGDDFYVMSSGLAMLETTIGNNNATLYKLITPKSVLEWVRNIVANRLAVSGATWVEVFSAFNSGTYNNENIIADFKKFVPGAPPAEGFLWGVDQIPGSCEAHDITSELLAAGYVGSYNVARFPKTYKAMGMLPLVAKYGPWFSFNDTARANIFRRDAKKVTNEADFKGLLRYNNFLHDPLSQQGCSGTPPSSAENAISARDDLNPSGGVYPIGALGFRDHAGIDAKLTSASRMRSLSVAAVSGPAYNEAYGVPMFSWASTPFQALHHLGHPVDWNFTFVEM